MFIINTEIEINWLLPATLFVLPVEDYDIIVKKPDGSSQYFESAITSEDYIPPTDSTTGGISYRLTPDQKGVWVIVLTVGTADDSDIFYEYFMQVHINDTHIYQQVNLG